MARVQLKDLNKKFDATHVVKDVNLEIRDHEFVVLGGPSGCGKTTTLRVQMRVELKRLHERLETTAIYVTHDQVEAMTLGDRVVVMKDGVVKQVGAPLELYQRPANRFVAGFIGSPAMNFIAVSLDWTANALWAHAPGMRVRVPPAKTEALRQYQGKPVVLGLRPEALHPPDSGT